MAVDLGRELATARQRATLAEAEAKGLRFTLERLEEVVGPVLSEAEQVKAERDRLRTALEGLITGWEKLGGEADTVEVFDLLAGMHQLVADARAQLDVTGEATDG